MEPIEQGPPRPLLGRRGFVAGAAALGAGVGLSATALAARNNGTADPELVFSVERKDVLDEQAAHLYVVGQVMDDDSGSPTGIVARFPVPVR